MKYNEDYYERGVEKKISGYENYRWLESPTLKMCESLINFAGLSKSDKIVDFGCAKGFLVKAMFLLGYDCVGIDISEYAIENSDPLIKDRLSLLNEDFYNEKHDCIICKDVLEHLDYEDLKDVLKKFSNITKKLVVIIPLGFNGKYIIEEYENDITHVIREDKDWWMKIFSESGFSELHFSYRVVGIKDNWSNYEKGNGFFLLRSQNHDEV